VLVGVEAAVVVEPADEDEEPADEDEEPVVDDDDSVLEPSVLDDSVLDAPDGPIQVPDG